MRNSPVRVAALDRVPGFERGKQPHLVGVRILGGMHTAWIPVMVFEYVITRSSVSVIIEADQRNRTARISHHANRKRICLNLCL